MLSPTCLQLVTIPHIESKASQAHSARTKSTTPHPYRLQLHHFITHTKLASTTSGCTHNPHPHLHQFTGFAYACTNHPRSSIKSSQSNPHHRYSLHSQLVAMAISLVITGAEIPTGKSYDTMVKFAKNVRDYTNQVLT